MIVFAIPILKVEKQFFFFLHTKNNCRYSKQMWHFHSAKLSDACQNVYDDESAHFTFKHTDTDLCSWNRKLCVWHQSRFESNWRLGDGLAQKKILIINIRWNWSIFTHTHKKDVDSMYLKTNHFKVNITPSMLSVLSHKLILYLNVFCMSIRYMWNCIRFYFVSITNAIGCSISTEIEILNENFPEVMNT